MKTFRWDWVSPLGESSEYLWLSERDGNIGKVWASILKMDENAYQPIIINKNRDGWITIKEFLPLEDAKQAIEEKLMNDGIIKDKDTLEDYSDKTP